MSDSENKLKNKKENPLHYPGQSLDKELNSQTLNFWAYIGIILFLTYLAVWEWLAWYLNTPRQPILFTVYFLIGVPFCLIMIFRIGKRIQNYRLGSEGEKIVGEELIELQMLGCVVLHDVVLNNNRNKFNIDHIVICDTGIYAIETKKRTKNKFKQEQSSGNPSIYEVEFDGERVLLKGFKPDSRPVTQALSNAESVRRLLKERVGKDYPVMGVLVYPDWCVKESTDGNIWLLHPEYLKWRIPKQLKRLNNDEIRLISKQLALFARG